MKTATATRSVLDVRGNIVSTQDVPQADLLIRDGEATLNTPKFPGFGHGKIIDLETGSTKYHLMITVLTDMGKAGPRTERWFVTF